MPNYGYHLARAQGSLVRRVYRSFLTEIVHRRIEPPAALPFEVFAYSGEAALPEQIASIRSLLRHAGRPHRITVVSDGTYSAGSIELLRRVDESVVVAPSSEWLPQGLPANIYPYLGAHPTGRQLALIMSLPVDRPALYVDSDVLFFPNASELASLAATRDVPAFYQLDCQFSGDERLLRQAAETDQPVNTGVLMLFRKLDWGDSVERFLQLSGEPTFFTNQTMTHLTMHANGARPFDPAKFVLKLDDQFVYADRYANEGACLRHYVNPVRHKFWTSLR